MKKIIIPISALFVAGLSHAQTTVPSNTENYVYSKTYIHYPKPADADQTIKSLETVQYLDGLGRAKQVVNVKASPLGRDVVSHIVYDQYGRQTFDYLPVPQGGTGNGAIVTDPLTNATQADIYGSEKIYAEKILEDSPLDRILEQKHVGNAWSSKPVKFEYDTNKTTDNVGQLVTVTSWINNTTISVVKTSGSFIYGPGKLFKNTVIDEDGNKTIEFKNGEGQILLMRKIISATENADTYYVYNEYNQLAFVVPPKAAFAFFNEYGAGTDDEIPSDILNNLCYQYKYDTKRRLVEKKIPGKGWEQMVYNRRDQIILQRDINLKNGITDFVQNEAWIFTKYDKFGRIAYTGISRDGTARQDIQNAVDNQPINVSYETRGGNLNMNGITIEYGNVSYPTSLEKILSVNYYDIYPVGSPPIPPPVLGQEILQENAQLYNSSTKSLPVASYIKNIEDDNWTKNYTWYDKKGRAVANHSDNHLGGYTKTESELSFSGIIRQTKTYHKRLSSEPEVFLDENFEYDNQNRLKKHFHQVNSMPVELLTENSYNELSQLNNKKVGNNLQSIDYAYNIRGWMTKINDPVTLNGKLFGYEIKYTNPTYNTLSIGRYNGNIAEIDWKTAYANNDILRRYNYSYDNLNRLSDGMYSEPSSSNPQNNYFNESVSYDLNGNIKTLKRYQQPQIGTTAEKIDDLIYNYQNNNTSNNLNNVSLPTGVVNNYLGYNALGNTINYDTNGNMTSIPDKYITTIKYNYLNLTNEVIVTNPYVSNLQNTKYIYRSDGVKLVKLFLSGGRGGVKKTDYLDGFQYEEGIFFPLSNLYFFPTSEGYYDYQYSRYVYHYSDHLGNVRLSYYKENSVPRIAEENNYYPFGLQHGNGSGPDNFYYNYRYNGKEMQESGMYDYGARFYMPELGRWGVIDPLAEQTKDPYGYVWNNPIKFIDPDGRSGKSTDVRNNGDGTYKVVGGNLNDGDKGIYVVDAKGKRTGDKIGESLTMYSFYNEDKQDGNGQTGWKGTIDTNSNESSRLVKGFMSNADDITLSDYMPNATDGKDYDFKRNGDPNNNDRENHHRGSVFGKKSDGTLVFASARDAGNYSAGYIAGLKGLSWAEARIGFDGLEIGKSLLKGNLVTGEGRQSTQAQRQGYNQGSNIYNRRNTLDSSNKEVRRLDNIYNNPK